MKIISNTLCRKRYKAQIKTKRIAKKNKANIYLFCILVILMIVLTRR
jgi:hypothetical protein